MADQQADAVGELHHFAFALDVEDHALPEGFVDDVIEPEETRPRLIAALEMLQTKRETLPPRKHGNIPL